MDPQVLSSLINAGVDLTAATAGGIGNIYGNRGKRRALEAIAKGSEKLSNDVGARAEAQIADLQELYGIDIAQYPELAQQFYDGVANTDLDQYAVEDPGDFEFDYAAETEAQMNPYLKDITDAAVGDVEQSAANAGKLFSGAAGKEIARATYDIRAKEYGNAADRAFKMGGQKYTQFTDKFQNILRARDFNKGIALDKLDLTKAGADMAGRGRDTFASGQGTINQTRDDAQVKLAADAIAARGQAKATPGGFGAFLQGFGGQSTEK